MSSISSLLSSSSLDISSTQKNQFKKLDADGNGKINQQEFIQGRPKGISEADATSLFNELDTNKTRELTQDQLAQLEKKKPTGDTSSLGSNLSSDIVGLLLALAGQSLATQSTGSEGQPSPDNVFASIDTDGNGSVSKAEFVSSRPDGISEKDASSLFDSIDTQGKGSLDQAQFETLAQNGQGGSSDQASADSSVTTNDDLIAKLLEAINAYSKNGNTSDQNSRFSSAA